MLNRCVFAMSVVDSCSTQVILEIPMPSDEIESCLQYLTSIVAEYMRTLNHFRLTISPNITCFLVSLLANSERCSTVRPINSFSLVCRYFQLHQFIQYKVINDSEAVAEQLLKLRHQHHASFQLAVDMLQRLRLSDRIVQVLLQEGKVIHSLRCPDLIKHTGARCFAIHTAQ